MELVEGTTLGPYTILSRVGAGGMGQVYRARDSRLERDVAINVLPEGFSNDPSALKRFQKEAKALASLSHPNILTVYDIGEQDGVTYVVTELLQGETLRSRIRTSPPGSASYLKDSSSDIESYYEFPLFLSFIVKNGRAVLYPVYNGTFERRKNGLSCSVAT